MSEEQTRIDRLEQAIQETMDYISHGEVNINHALKLLYSALYESWRNEPIPKADVEAHPATALRHAIQEAKQSPHGKPKRKT